MNLVELKRIISLQLGIRDIGDEDRFLEDLKAESFDVMNIIVAVEEKYNITIDETEIPRLTTPAALYAFVQSHMDH